ncbi:hypothetical protein [Sporosarcina sp. Te-1]|uniref:hypothetical protein n=1 Tax=Sporosarcina sp. Te-1 TaxID=2818390 RepID=UPI001A9F91F8|nr:hypothetical protein [Sporosarcina sp. Te-1]QTD40142.1 hypothetical protein J3U78_15135 [Sporosarcina sp. Te-1]
MDLFFRRRELWIFVLSVFILGGEIGLLVNVLFTEFYTGNEHLFIFSLSLLILLTIILIIKLMLLNSAEVYESELTLVYNTGENKFIDIPYNPASVNARVLMDNLGVKKQEKIKIDHIFDEDNDFRNFSNNIVAQLVLGRFIRHFKVEYSEKVKIEDLKELLVIYRYLDIDSIIGDQTFNISNGVLKTPQLKLPKGFKFNSNSINNIKIKSNYGFINFNWNINITNNTQPSQLLSTFKEIDFSECLEVRVKLKLEYGYNVFKIFMNNTVEYNEFIKNSKKQISKFSTEVSREKYNNSYPEKLIRYLDKHFNDILKK